jgi:hypothetical protein
MNKTDKVLDRILVDVADDTEHVIHDQPGDLNKKKTNLF